ncbi:hypothetical protein F2Q68_00044121 [Brassica cretica]|uniref:Uncharacterized protein n=2 Tax=Brassica cretica TaxID=69181 RepID=A0ABQ7B1V8_BRACR|nr:hypothetical protein F2Q68_00044121 [Brassica cretica]KAF3520226.1 hypothetical protein DY000_02060152 [Brassica cretica]
MGFKIDLSAFYKDRNQEKWPWNYEIMIHPPKPAIPKTAQPSSISQETGGTSKTSKFICADESVKCHVKNQVTIDVLMELMCFLPSFHFDELKENPTNEAIKCSPHGKQLELMILNEPKVFSQSNPRHIQKKCKDHGMIVSAHLENVLKPRISKQKQIFTWLKNVLLKPFHELFSLSCALKEIWFRKRHEPKLLRPKNQFDFIHDENFSKLALSHSFHNSFTAWPDFEIDKPIFGNHFTCLMFAHVLDDYPKSLDPVFDVLRKEKPFDYFFRIFDVVSLVVLKVQDIKDQFQMEASRGGRHNTCVPGTWNWKYLKKTSSKLQESFSPNLSFIEFYLFLKFVLSDSFSFDSGKMDLRTNPFEEGEYDTPWIEHRPVWFMDTAQGGFLVYQLDQTEVFMSDHASLTVSVSLSDHSVHADHNFPSDRADQTVRTIPSGHPTVLATVLMN